METQEQIYAEMNRRNEVAAPQPFDVATEPTTCCLAAWTGGAWYLKTAYRRLMDRLTTLVGDYMTFYWPEGSAYLNHGILHQTLLQLVGFRSFDALRSEVLPTIMDAAAAIIKTHAFPLSVEYRGLVWTPTGLAIAGYTADYDRLMNLRDLLDSVHGAAVPYKNDIVHATIGRWIRVPPPHLLVQLRDEVARWQEAVFGHLVVRSWTVGAATLLMRPVDRHDYTTIRVPLHIYHRGNSRGAPDTENDPNCLSTIVAAGRHVEVDVWLRDGAVFVGHDAPTHIVAWDWLVALAPRALIHCKDGATFVGLRTWFAERGLEADLFYHTTEDYALSTGGKIIVYPGRPLFPNCLSMMPESIGRKPLAEPCAEICSDILP
jgi:hypothetical protein